MDKETYLEEGVYFITEREGDEIHITVGETENVEIPNKLKNGDKWIKSEKVCVECKSWNIWDANREEYFCPICD